MKKVSKVLDIRIFLFCMIHILLFKIKLFFLGKKISEEDKVFRDRFLYNPRAFFVSFRQNHFELHSLELYPKIKWNMLDFWCWSGHLDILLTKKWYHIHWIDLSYLGIKIANKLKKMSNTKKLSFELCDITKKTPKEKFDCCWATQVFEHIKDPSDVFKGLQKRIKPQWKILISVPLWYAYNDKWHVNHFMNKKELEDYLKKHIQIDRIDIDEKYKVIRALCNF